jgi:hypothetical protein
MCADTHTMDLVSSSRLVLLGHSNCPCLFFLTLRSLPFFSHYTSFCFFSFSVSAVSFILDLATDIFFLNPFRSCSRHTHTHTHTHAHAHTHTHRYLLSQPVPILFTALLALFRQRCEFDDALGTMLKKGTKIKLVDESGTQMHHKF